MRPHLPALRASWLALWILSFGLEPLHAGERPFLWKVESKTATVYLLGSIHLAKPDLYPLDRRIDKAFDSSDVLAVEADPTGMGGIAAAGLMLSSGLYPEGESLKQHVPKTLFDDTAKKFADYGLPEAQWTRFRPWFAAMTITITELQRLGMLPEHGIDVHFIQRARGSKEILELEGAEAQIRMLAGFGEDQQRLFLEYTLRDVETLSKQTDEMIDAWRRGDAKGIEKMILEPLRAEARLAPIYEKLFDERNVAMAETIGGYLDGRGTTFVIAGAGHLVGRKGLVELLGRRFTVKQL